jgi:hypothetical protein
MKSLRILALCACLYSVSYNASAQTNKFPINEPDNNKPRLFQSYPEKIAVNTDVINSLFSTPVGSITASQKSDGVSFPFEGEVISTVSKYENRIISVVIRPAGFPNAYLTVSRITDESGNISYTGHIISKGKGDAYVLQQENGLFSLIKKNYNDIVIE